MMKRFATLFIALLSALAVNAKAVEIDGIYYNLISKAGVAEVTASPNTNYYSGDIVIPEFVTYEDKDYAVTTIAMSAFYGCRDLTSITIPNSVTAIGLAAFADCSSLTSVTIPNSVTSISGAFRDCYSLTSVTIPNSVTDMNGAFEGCINLTSVTIPSSVTSISGAFQSCYSLTSVTIPNSVTSINGAFRNCYSLTSVTIPNSVTDMNGAFGGCINLTSVTIPNSVTIIGSSTFSSCTSLTSISIPNTVTHICSRAFQGCTGLTSVTIPSSVTTIEDDAFSSCQELTDVYCYATDCPSISSDAFRDSYIKYATLHVPAGCKAAYQAASVWKDFGTIVEFDSPIVFADANVKAICVQNWDTDGDGELSTDEAAAVTDLGEAFTNNKDITSFDELQYFTGLTTIPASAFYSCVALKSIRLPENVNYIGMSAFYVCTGLTSVTIPLSVKSIGIEAFRGCTGLTSVTIPPSVKSIGGEAFRSCTGLISVAIPNSVTSIGGDAFAYCTSLTSMTLPNSVTRIENNTFYGCYSLTSITIPNSVTIIGDNAFASCTNLTSVTIPHSLTSIGYQAFSGCVLIKDVYCYANSAPSIADFAFADCNMENLTLHVPAGCRAAYQRAAGWSGFGTIVEMAPLPGEYLAHSRNIGDYLYTTTGRVKILGENVITNGTFAEGTEGWYGETISDSPLADVWSVEDGLGPNGESVVKVSLAAGLTGGLPLCGFWGEEDGIEPGETYVVSFDIKGEGDGATSVTSGGTNYADIFINSDFSFAKAEGATSVATVANFSTEWKTIAFTTSIEQGQYIVFHFEKMTQGVMLTNMAIQKAQVVYDDRIVKARLAFAKQLLDDPNFNTEEAKEAHDNLTENIIPGIEGAMEAGLFDDASAAEETMNSFNEELNAYLDVTSQDMTSTLTTLDFANLAEYGRGRYTGAANLELAGGNWGHPAGVDYLMSAVQTGYDHTATFTVKSGDFPAGKYFITAEIRNANTGKSSWPCPEQTFNLSTQCKIFIGTDSVEIGPVVGEEYQRFYLVSELTGDEAFRAGFYWPGPGMSKGGAFYIKNVTVRAFGDIIIPDEPDAPEPASPTIDVTDISQMDNVIYIEETEAKTGAEKTISLKMKNSVDVAGFEFVLQLPEGVTVATDDDGLYESALSTARTTATKTNYFDSSLQADGTLKVLCGTSRQNPNTGMLYTFSGNDGEVATIKLSIAADMADGTYPIVLKSIKLSDPNSVKYETAEVTSKLTVSTYTLGDPNNDGSIDVADFIAVANRILDRTPAGFIEKAGDINEDGTIDVADFIAIANLILHNSNANSQAGARAAAPRRSATDIDALMDVIYVEPVSASAGTQQVLSVKMKNTAEVAGFEFELQLPEGITIATDGDGMNMVELSTARTTATKTNYFDSSLQADGTLKVLCGTSRQNPTTQKLYTFSGNDGEVARITVNIPADYPAGEYVVVVKNAIISDPDAVKTELTPTVETTMTIGEADIVVLDENSTTAPEATDGPVDILVKRTLKANEWSTICLPFDMTETQLKASFGNDVELKEFTDYEADYDADDNVTSIIVNFDDADLSDGFYGNYPYLIKVSADIHAFTVNSTINPDENDSYAEYTNGRTGNKKEVYGTFRGTLHAGTTVPENALFVSGNKFWYSAGRTEMKAFRAYFEFVDVLSSVDAASARISMSFNETTECGDAVRQNHKGKVTKTYTLEGIQVERPTKKGVYIRDGKKIVIK